MKRLLLASAFALGLAVPASADVILDPHLAGTGDNVVFDSINGNTVIGSLNGQHINLVNFTDLSGNPNFSGSQNGNDIKIVNTSDLFVQVFDSTDTVVVGTTEQVFSLKGTGTVDLTVQATDGTFQFLSLGPLSPSAQSGFTLTAINGEAMSSLTIVDNGGSISDFEHYRIDVVPGPIVGAGIPGIVAGCLTMLGLARRRWRRLRG